jgi:DNA-binding MarR family transcriptional regulator
MSYFEDIQNNYPRLLSIAKRHFEIWASNNLCNHIANFKTSYMPFIANINPNGSTNNEIAKRAVIAKQGMSRTIKELEQLNMIVLEKDKKDKRSSKIKLSAQGKIFMDSSVSKIVALTNEYKKIIGDENYDITLASLAKIIAYHETLVEVEE